MIYFLLLLQLLHNRSVINSQQSLVEKEFVFFSTLRTSINIQGVPKCTVWLWRGGVGFEKSINQRRVINNFKVFAYR